MTGLEGKVALVTGGSGGIGAAICERLAAAGAKVATNYRNKDKAERWQAEVRGKGFEIPIYRADVSDYAACAGFVEQVEAELGPVAILVNNAGITRDGMFKKMSREQWDAVMAVNLDGLFNMTRQVIAGMSERGWGRIVNISSINGQKGQLGQSNYAAAKAGMHGFTMSLAQELAGKGVTVNTVSPGYIATDMVMAVPEEIRARIIAGIPVKRLGKPEEIAAMVAFLCSEEAAFATGADFSVNGGQHMM